MYDWEPAKRNAFLLRAGIAITLAFVLVRALNVYGDPRPWSAQSTSMFTLLSFLNVTKYPPSLSFLLMTLGPALLFLRAADARTPAWLRPALVYGRVPMFYYIVHFTLIHALAVVVCWFRYGSIHWMLESQTPDRYPFTAPPGWPLSLGVVYIIWIGLVVALWPVCRWFGGVKARRREWWLSYL